MKGYTGETVTGPTMGRILSSLPISSPLWFTVNREKHQCTLFPKWEDVTPEHYCSKFGDR